MVHVILLHGLGADRRAFQRFERLLPDAWRITTADLLGHGDAPKPASGYSLDEHARYIAEVIEGLGGGSAGATRQQTPGAPVLVGHSYGAATSVAVAATRPELVTGIALLDPIVRLDHHEPASKTARMIEARFAGTLDLVVAELFPDASPALQAWTVETWSKMSEGVLRELDGDWMRFAARVVCPVWVIHGQPEHGGAGDLAADWFDDPRVVPIEGTGHYLHATHARETADAVVNAVREMAPT